MSRSVHRAKVCGVVLCGFLCTVGKESARVVSTVMHARTPTLFCLSLGFLHVSPRRGVFLLVHVMRHFHTITIVTTIILIITTTTIGITIGITVVAVLRSACTQVSRSPRRGRPPARPLGPFGALLCRADVQVSLTFPGGFSRENVIFFYIRLAIVDVETC